MQLPDVGLHVTVELSNVDVSDFDFDFDVPDSNLPDVDLSHDLSHDFLVGFDADSGNVKCPFKVSTL